MKNILLLSDLDGTLLDKSQKVSPENEAAIQRFRAMGGRFTLATGRMEESVLPFIKRLNIDMPVIIYNGAKIYCPETNKTLYEKNLVLSSELWKSLMNWVSEEVVMLIYQEGKLYSPERTEILEHYEKKDGVRCWPLSPDRLEQPVTKVMFISPNLGALNSIEQMVLESRLDCEMVYSESNYLEILPAHVSKGAALEQLIHLLGLEQCYTIAVGDNLNDLSLIKQANRGYAVENSHPQLKEAADEMTVHHEQHAIAAIIDEIMNARSERT